MSRQCFTIYLEIIAVACLSLTGCKTTSYQEEMQSLLENKRWLREIRKSGYVIRIQYLPMRYFELRHLMVLPDSAQDQEKVSAVEMARSMYDNGIYFMMTVALEDHSKDIMNRKIANTSEWSAELQKFHFRLGEYIYIQTESIPEINLNVYDFQNTFGYTKDRKVMMCFPKVFNDRVILDDPTITIVIKDWGWDIGKQSVRWDADDLKIKT